MAGAQIQDILAEIKNGVRGVTGSFVIDSQKSLVGMDMPELLSEEIKKISFNISFLIEQVGEKRGLERMQITAENGNMLIVSDKDFTVCCVTSKEANLGLAYLLAKKTLGLLKGVKLEEIRTKTEAARKEEEKKKKEEEERKRTENILERLRGFGV